MKITMKRNGEVEIFTVENGDVVTVVYHDHSQKSYIRVTVPKDKFPNFNGVKNLPVAVRKWAIKHI